MYCTAGIWTHIYGRITHNERARSELKHNDLDQDKDKKHELVHGFSFTQATPKF